MSDKILILLSDSFPYGIGETFLGEELNYLAQEFTTIYILPDYIPSDGVARPIPQNCKVDSYLAEKKILYSIPQELNRKGLNARILWKELRVTPFGWFVKNFSALRKLASKNIFEAEVLGSWIKHNIHEPYLIYSFWFSNQATSCAILKNTGFISDWVSGIHGYDLYHHRHSLERQPFLNFKLDNCKQLFTACLKAREYLLPIVRTELHTKISNRYLGVKIPTSTVQPKGNTFVLVSCSYMIPLKRIDLIIALLHKITFPVKWIHIGDGPERNKLTEMIYSLPNHISVELKGNVSNELIQEIYLSENPHLFLHFSESEGGSPVSIMDALSCGIPILACDAGGVSEMITKDVGKVLPVTMDLNEAMDFIFKIYKGDLVFDPMQVQQYCAKNFSAEVNYSLFAKKLKL